jgi:hypothetical protein
MRAGGAVFSIRIVKLYARFRDAAVFVFVNDQCVGFVENAVSFGQGITPEVSTTTGGSATAVSVFIARARFTVFGACMDEPDEPLTSEDVTAILRAHRHLVAEDGPLRDWWRETRRDGRPPQE